MVAQHRAGLQAHAARELVDAATGSARTIGYDWAAPQRQAAAVGDDNPRRPAGKAVLLLTELLLNVKAAVPMATT
jgi:hypothetical protein